MGRRRGTSRREWLRSGAWAWAAGVAAAGALRSDAGQEPGGDDHSDRLAEGYPRPTGRAGRGMGRFDEIVLEILDMYGMTGASLAIAKDGRLVLARGYGWANLRERRPMRLDNVLCIASCSKSVTAAAILRLVDEGRLDVGTPVFRILDHLEPFPGERPDPRLRDITVRHLLYHAGGWDTGKGGEPMQFSGRVARHLGIRPPISQVQLIRYMMGRPLDFTPGTETHYSNFGFIVLRHVIQRISGRPEEEFCRDQILRPMGITRMRLELPRPNYAPDEARRYGEGGHPMYPGGHQHMLGPAGSWLARPTDLVRFLHAVAGEGPRPFLSRAARDMMLAPPGPPVPVRPNGTHFGMGWDTVSRKQGGHQFGKDGGVSGIEAWIEHLPGGVDWAIVFNSGHHKAPGMPNPIGAARRKVAEAVGRLTEWPDVDLFEEGPAASGP